jgi:hypothetical protein
LVLLWGAALPATMTVLFGMQLVLSPVEAREFGV